MTVMFHLMHSDGKITVTEPTNTLTELGFMINTDELLAHLGKRAEHSKKRIQRNNINFLFY